MSGEQGPPAGREFVHDDPATRVVFGVGTRRRVADELDRLGVRRAFVVFGGHEQAYADEVGDDLGERVAGRFSDVVMHVPVATAQAAVATAADAGADGVVAIGGGSAIGTAKAVALETGLPILALPTTYAGSEMTPIWGLTQDDRKTTGRDLRVLPKVVVYDPEVTLTLPADVSAASGMNAVAHLVEALYAPSVSPLTSLAAEEGIRALAVGLPGVSADPHDLGARTEAMYGAWLGGWTLGMSTMGVHHKICHALGGTWGLPHAPTHAAVLPYATAYNAPAAPSAMTRIVGALTRAGRPVEEAAAGVWDLADQIGAPTSLAGLGFPPEAVERAARLVVDGRPLNPRPVDVDGLRWILEHALRGDRPTGHGRHAEGGF